MPFDSGIEKISLKSLQFFSFRFKIEKTNFLFLEQTRRASVNIPLKQPTNSLANNPTICVDHMKHYLYYIFLSLLLSGCGGGDGGTSSSGGSSSKKPQSCDIANGSGHKVWDKTAKKYSTICTVVTCNAGFDNHEDSTQCQSTVSGFFSLSDDKNRKACPTIPVHSFATGRTGLSSPHDCWSCHSGYLKNIRGRVSCNFPSKGKYINVLGNEQSCNNVGGAPGGFNEFLDNTRGVSSANGCNFSCRSGYVNNPSTYSCNKAQSCAIANGRGQKLWNSRTNIYSATCEVVDCNTGLVKNTGGNTCDIPDQGKYADWVGDEQSCDTPTGATGGFDTFLPNTGAVSAADGCGFSCSAGFVKDSFARECNYPTLGKYVNNQGTEAPCNSNSITLQGTATSTWIAGAAATDTTCPFSCSAGFVKDSFARECNYPTLGKYVNNQGTEAPCNSNSITLQGTATSIWIAGAADSATTCHFSCSTGFVANSGNRTCNFPRKGKYVNVSGSEQSCSDLGGTVGGFNEFLVNTRGVNAATGCSFSCRSGYVKSVSNYSCTQGQTCPIANGVGFQQTPSASCHVVDCNAGYDSVANPAQCQPAALGFFSLANDKTRKQCPTTIPDHSLKNTATGSALETDCWNCKTGSLKNTSNKKCTLPGKGKYYDAQGNLQSCNNVGGTPSGGFSHWEINTAPVPSADKCKFSCKSRFTKSESLFSCSKSTSCSVTNGRGLNLWDTNTNKFSTTCTLETCDAGYDNDVDTAQCQQTASGFYSPANDKTRTACPTPSHSSATGNIRLSSADGCYDCDAGFVNAADRTCKIPDQGKYADNAGDEQGCSSITGAATGFKTFLPNTGAVSSATGCGFSCNSGFVKIGRACNTPDTGKYADNAGDEQGCSSITGATGGFDTFLPNTGAVSSATGCGFSCNSGFVKIGRACNTPDTGKYADNVGVEQSCDTPTGATGGFNTFLPNTVAVNSAAGCDFSCNAGFVKDSSARECKYPALGHYADAQGVEDSCTDISGTPHFGSWVSGAATDADACPFSCSTGFTVSGSMCREYKPQMLALGQDTSHVLFDNGEVEAWGSVSTYPWRTHVKKDLGSHTPQALVSGDRHRCIILENAGLKHGRLMCWGSNSVFYAGLLGVGDENDRDTPTAVTATVLGDAGDGIPNTVKFVAAGHSHSCAILSNDTVVCWGNKISGQIGGMAYTLGNNTTISGTEGSPLDSRTASRIAVGEHYTCAVLSNNSVRCWGLNDYGQTGGGTPHSDRTISGSAGDPLNGGSASRIAAGEGHSCAILNNGTVKCWGDNYDDQTGGGTPSLGVGKTATHIAIGAWSKYTCTLLNDKTVKCWGQNGYGQIGGGIERSDRILRGSLGNPLGGQTAIQIAVGEKHTCAIMESDNSVKCWGKNIHYNKIGFYGQIIGEVAMTGGSDGTGTSTGETATLTATSIPTATVLEADASGKICKIDTFRRNPWHSLGC